MKLKKSICKRCSKNSVFTWKTYDEYLWEKQGSIICFVNYDLFPHYRNTYSLSICSGTSNSMIKLKKSVCKRCRILSKEEWDEYDEKRWREMNVVCHYHMPLTINKKLLIVKRRSIVYITEIPPYCPYSLEHLTQ